MTSHDLERSLTAMLADGADRAPAASRPLVAQRVAQTRQRPAWLARTYGRPVSAGVLGWRWPGRVTSLLEVRAVRFVLLAALLAAAVTALGVMGSRLAPPPPPDLGLLAVGSMDTTFVVDPVSGTSHAITAPTPHDFAPVWSPDGSRMVLSQDDGRGRLQLIDADGANRHPLVDDMSSSNPAAWSPDGSRIAFSGYHYPGAAGLGLYVVNADGTGLTLLVPGEGRWPSRLAWSPDGSLIAFAAVDPERPTDDATGYAYVVDVASGTVTPVSSSRVDHDAGGPLAWRPGRMELLYAQTAGEGREDLVLAERVGDTWRERPPVQDLAAGSIPNPVTWLDADRFAYQRGDRMVVAFLDGRPELPIGLPGDRPVAPGCVAPDGSLLAILTGDVEQSEEQDTLLLLATDGGAPIPAFTGWMDRHWSACSWQPVGD